MMQEQQKVVFSATFAEEMKNMRDAQFQGLPECEAMGRVRSVLESKGVYMSAESVQEIVLAAQAEREPYTYCCIHAALAAQPKQAKGGEDVAGELDPRRSYEFGQLITKYSESFNGQNWDSVCGSVDRKNLAVALDHLTEAGAMLMNISERLLRTNPAPAASAEREARVIEQNARKAAQEQLYAERERHTAEVKRLQAEIGRLKAPAASVSVSDELTWEQIAKAADTAGYDVQNDRTKRDISTRELFTGFARAILALRPAQAGVQDGGYVGRLRVFVNSVAESEIPEMEDYSEAARRFFAEEPTKESGA